MLWCSTPRTDTTPRPSSRGGVTTANHSSPASKARVLAPAVHAFPNTRLTNTLPNRTPSKRIPQTTDSTFGRSSSVVRSAMRAESAVPPAAMAIPMATKTAVNRRINQDKFAVPALSMTRPSCNTSWQASPNSNARKNELQTMKGVRRKRLTGIRSER